MIQKVRSVQKFVNLPIVFLTANPIGAGERR